MIRRVLVLVSLFSLALLAPATASAFTVNNLADTDDSDPGDGFCAAPPNHCTLRAAIQEANAHTGADDVDFSVNGTILLGSELVVNDDTTITGPGASKLAVDGNSAVRVFNVQNGPLVMTDLTVQHGSSNNGGGILNQDSTLILTNVVVRDNVGIAGLGAQVSGGGISSQGASSSTTIGNSTISNNHATAAGTGTDDAVASGAGIFQSMGTLKINSSTISGNEAKATVTAGTPGSTTVGRGAGINAVQANTELNFSTVTGNTAAAAGGVDNSSTEAGGVRAGDNTDDFLMLDSTVAGNTAAVGANVQTASLTISGGETSMQNTIIANPLGGGANCDANPTVKSNGYNLEYPGTGCIGGTLNTGDLQNVNPRLGPLASNGGPTKTMLLLKGSAAIDKGFSVQANDQRGPGYPRLVNAPGIPNANAGVDIGALEGDPFPPSTRYRGKTVKPSRRRATFRFSSSQSGSKFKCRLDRRSYTYCRSAKTYRHLRDGRHTFRVYAIDPSGNLDASPLKKRFRI